MLNEGTWFLSSVDFGKLRPHLAFIGWVVTADTGRGHSAGVWSETELTGATWASIRTPRPGKRRGMHQDSYRMGGRVVEGGSLENY